MLVQLKNVSSKNVPVTKKVIGEYVLLTPLKIGVCSYI